MMWSPGEAQKALLGSLKLGEGALTSCPLTMGKAALILLSQAEDPQARREGSARAKITSLPWKLEV